MDQAQSSIEFEQRAIDLGLDLLSGKKLSIKEIAVVFLASETSSKVREILHADKMRVEEERIQSLVRSELAAERPDEAAPSSPANKQNGPSPPNLVWWKGERFRLPPRLWMLAAFMWDRDKAPLQEVEHAVWDRELVLQKTVASTVSKLNRSLTEIGCPWTLRIQKGYLEKT